MFFCRMDAMAIESSWSITFSPNGTDDCWSVVNNLVFFRRIEVMAVGSSWTTMFSAELQNASDEWWLVVYNYVFRRIEAMTWPIMSWTSDNYWFKQYLLIKIHDYCGTINASDKRIRQQEINLILSLLSISLTISKSFNKMKTDRSIYNYE